LKQTPHIESKQQLKGELMEEINKILKKIKKEKVFVT
jgi:hypothetical protein